MAEAEYDDRRSLKLAGATLVGILFITALLGWLLTAWVIPGGIPLGLTLAVVVFRRADSQHWLVADGDLIFTSGARREVFPLADIHRVSSYGWAETHNDPFFEFRGRTGPSVPIDAHEVLWVIGREMRRLGVEPQLDGDARSAIGWPRLALPTGAVGAVWGSWPFVAIALASVAGAGWPTSPTDALLPGAFIAAGVFRSVLWARNRRQNRITVTEGRIEITTEGQTTVLSLGEITKATWWFGHPSATFDRMRDYTMLVLERAGDEEVIVDLLLPRVSEQRRAIQDLGRCLPDVLWRVGWSTVGDALIPWSPQSNPTPPKRFRKPPRA